MASKEYYTPADASEVTGASKAALRLYTGNYARWFSTEATPGGGATRKFTAGDLKLITYIRQQTSLGATHEAIQEQLLVGALDAFVWEPPGEVMADENQQTALTVPMERLQAAQALLQDARQREERLQEEIRQERTALHQKVEELQRELGEAKGELTAHKELRRKPPRWWVALFGGE